jgi:hypothetical protein
MMRLLSVLICAGAALSAQSKQAGSIAPDPGWPRVYTDGKATIAVHQPQVEDWKDFKLLEAKSAIEILPGKGEKKLLAAVHWQAKTATDLTARTVALGPLDITRFHIPGVDAAKTAELEGLTLRLLPGRRDSIALDRILPYLDQSRVEVRQVEISREAPPIMVSTKPAVLVMIDGQPILGPVEGTDLSFVVNTNWDLFKEKDGDFYLLHETLWLTAEALEGPWKSASKLPKEFKSLPSGENWVDVKKQLPMRDDNKKRLPPWVFLAQQPSELILLKGEPKLAPIPGTALSDVTNTESLLFFHNGDAHYYFLVSGRWFKNTQLRGNWEFASDRLPEDFQKIPLSHPKSFVRASVPGTDEAEDAVLLAGVPQVAVINRKEAAKEAKVTYVGAPDFKAVEGTSLQYAVNTPSDVILASGKYYLCQEGVWFVSASANGPWEVADMIPQEIYKIPPQSPKYNTTYVYVTNSDSETVTTAQTAGYMGLAIGVGIGVAVWGTGYYYPPYYYYGPMYPYPVYWGYPYHSYGAAAWYNPATGFYGRGAVAYGPYGGYGRAAAYNPATGTYARRAAAYGPYQAGMATSFYNPRTGAWGGGYRYANPYQGWGQGAVAKGDQWARGGYYYDDRGAVGGVRTSEGGKLVAAGDGDNRGMIGKTSDGDLYVGKNGEVYKREESGSWQHHGENGWSSVNHDSLSAEQQQRVDSAKNQQGQRASQTVAATGEGGLSRGSGSVRAPSATTSEAQHARPSASTYDNMRSLDRDAGARSRGNYGASSYGGGRSYSGGRSYGGGGHAGGGRRR